VSLPDDRRRSSAGAAQLIVASALMLMSELALIRWAAAFVVYVAYVTNLVLLASFLGIGIGFLRARRDRDPGGSVALAVAAASALIWLLQAQVPDPGADVEGLLGAPAPPVWLVLPAVFAVTTLTMAVLAEAVGRRFIEFAPLDAYRWDVVGSLIGIAAFTFLAFVAAPPVVWAVAIGAMGWYLAAGQGRRASVGAVAIVAVFALGSFGAGVSWSPYYRLSVETRAADRISIHVNGLPHQAIRPLDALVADQPFYVAAYEHLTRPPGRVLIIGAGNGNDVAVALARGARTVDAVEIDREILAVGRARHPARPYADPRVTAHVDDGRAFLERTDRRWDLILFALPDSLTLVTGQGSLRLESYLFTTEAMEAVRDHLNANGTFSMYNYYRPFVFERYAATMREVFGNEPCLDAGEASRAPRQQAVLTVSRAGPDGLSCPMRWTPGADVPEPATDDHPFPYLRGRELPAASGIGVVAILAFSLVAVRRGSRLPFREMRPFVDLFLMGAAFLLLETQNVVRFALLFGTTWLVNALVFAGILLSVLAAIEVSRRWAPRSRSLLPALLLGSVAVAWLVPADALLILAPLPRFAAAVAVAFTPVFLANLVFAQRFRDVGSSTVAFGANLLGAMVGGLAEYLAVLTGYRALLLLVAALYVVAIRLGPRAGSAPSIPGRRGATVAA